MNKINRQINKLIKKYQNRLTLISGILIITNFLIYKLINNDYLNILSLLVVTILCGLPIIYRGIMNLFTKVIGIETLVSIAVLGALLIGEYHEAAIVTFLFQFGNYLELKTITKTRKAIKSLTQMMPKTALKLDAIDTEAYEIDVDDIKINDLLLVKTGSMISVDGVLVSGDGYVNEASITGESKLVYKDENSLVYAGTILDNGSFIMRANRIGEDTTFGKIISLIEEAQDAKSIVDRFIDRFAKWYTPLIIICAFIIYLFTKEAKIAITILVLACPGALVIGSPVASVAGIGKGAKDYILLKGGDAIYNYAKVKTIVFDKTGTLTKGKPFVVREYYFKSINEEVLAMIYSLEKASNHPLALALVNHLEKQNIKSMINLSAVSIKGEGLIFDDDNKKIIIGNEVLISKYIKINKEENKIIDEYKNDGCSIILVADDKQLLAIYGIRDEIRDEAKDILAKLKSNGIKKIIMLSGDHEISTKIIAKELNIDEYHSNLLPEDKLTFIKKLKEAKDYIAFVGDGINDAPALAISDSGIAVGGGTDVAIETSDIVLMRDGIIDLAKSYILAKKTMTILWENIFIAIFTVVILLIGLLLGYIHMASGMFIHEASILIVILNAMRLLIYKGDGR